MLPGSLPPWWPSREPSVAASARDPDTGSLPAKSITSSCFCLALRGSLGPSPRPLLGFGSSLPSLLPRLYPAARQWLPRVTAVSQPPAWVHRPWVGGVGGGRLGKEPESGGTDGRYPVGSRGFGGEGRREQLSPLILKRSPSPRDVGLWGVTCGTRDPGLPREARRVRALGRLPRERWGRSRHSATFLGTLTQRSSSGSLLPAGRVV